MSVPATQKPTAKQVEAARLTLTKAAAMECDGCAACDHARAILEAAK